MCLGSSGAMPEAGKDNIMQVKRGFADLLAFLFDVDIVCINQADIGKKTNQVGIMGNLYGIATSVIVFLSEESDDSDLAILLLLLFVLLTSFPSQRLCRTASAKP
jgi:hypothetical protein